MWNNRPDSEEEFIIDIPDILGELARHILWILLSAIIFAVVALAFEKYLHKPQYTASTSMYVLAKNNEKSDLTTSDLQAGSLLTKDYEEIIKSRGVASYVIDDLDLTTSKGEMTYEEFRKKIHIRVPDDTRIIYISVTDKDPETAKMIANAVSRESAEKIMEVMNVENVQTLDEAVTPVKPSNINMKKMLVAGGAAGFILACIIVIVMYFLNDTVKSEDDIEKLLQISTLAVIPDSKAMNPEKGRKSRKGKINGKFKKRKY